MVTIIITAYISKMEETHAPGMQWLHSVRQSPELIKKLSRRGSEKSFNIFSALPILIDTLDASQLSSYMYSGLVFLYRLAKFTYMPLVYVGKYLVPTASDKGDTVTQDVQVFAERHSGLLFSEIANSTSFVANAADFYVLTHPLYVEEVLDHVWLASTSHDLLVTYATPNPGFITPLCPITKPGLLTLPIETTIRLLGRARRKMYLAHNLAPGMLLKLSTYIPEDVYKAYDLARDGYFGTIVPENAVEHADLHDLLLQFSSVLIDPDELRGDMESGSIWFEIPPIESATHEMGGRLGTKTIVSADQVSKVDIGATIAFQPFKDPSIVHVVTFYGLGSAYGGEQFAVLSADDSLYSMPLSKLERYAGKNRVWTYSTEGVSTKFAAKVRKPELQYPRQYLPTPVEESSPAQSFHRMIKNKECVRDAWMQREGTCWAAALLNVITLTPSLRDVFLSQFILTGPLNPAGQTALTVQRAVACKSTEDAPFCAFSGPEMVCQQLRVRLNQGHNGAEQFKELMSAADIDIGDGYDLRQRFHLVKVSVIDPVGYKKRFGAASTPGFVLDVHAVAAIIFYRGYHQGHVLAGIRCPNNTPGQQESYFIPDYSRLLEFNWLEECQNDRLTIDYVRYSLGADESTRWVEFDVLCDLRSENIVTGKYDWSLLRPNPKPVYYYALRFVNSSATQVMIVEDQRIRFFQESQGSEANFVKILLAKLADQGLRATSDSTFSYKGVPCLAVDVTFPDGGSCGLADRSSDGGYWFPFLANTKADIIPLPYFTITCTLSDEAGAMDWILSEEEAVEKYGVAKGIPIGKADTGCVYKNIKCGLLGDFEDGTVGRVVTYEEAVCEMISMQDIAAVDPDQLYSVQSTYFCDAPLAVTLGTCARTKLTKAPFLAMVKYPYAGQHLTTLVGPVGFLSASIYLLRGLIRLHESDVYHFNIKDTHVLVKDDFTARFSSFGGMMYFKDNYITGLTPQSVNADVPQNYFMNPFDVAISYITTRTRPKPTVQSQAYCVRKWMTNHRGAASALISVPDPTQLWPELDQDAVVHVIDITTNPVSRTQLYKGIDTFAVGMSLTALAGQVANTVKDTFHYHMYMTIAKLLKPTLHYDIRYRQALPDILEGLETLAKTWTVLDLVPAPSPLR